MIRYCRPSDASRIAGIYNYYVRETVVTFEEEPVSESRMEQRIEGIADRFPWLVWEQSGSVLGYAYASGWNERAAYRFCVETTIYLSPDHVRSGIGAQLYATLIEDLRRQGFHVAIGGIALPNPESVALHEKLGFSKTAHFKEVGWKLGRWVDVGYWELILAHGPAKR